MGELWGVLAAVLSSSLGGTAVGATRYLVAAIDPFGLGALRFSIGFVLLLPLAWLQRGGFPQRKDWATVAGLGAVIFALFPVLFNAALIFTTSARGALALSTMPLLTMALGAWFGVESLTLRKTIGVLIAIAGVAFSLLSDLASAPPGAWRGDLLMVTAALCMALYSIGSKSVMQRSAPIPFTTMTMGVGAAILAVGAWLNDSFGPVATFGVAQWGATLYLGVVGGALIFYLWSFALKHASPTQVTISVTLNPVSAALVGALLLDEPLSWNLGVGIVAVFVGIWVATMAGRRALGNDGTVGARSLEGEPPDVPEHHRGHPPAREHHGQGLV